MTFAIYGAGGFGREILRPARRQHGEVVFIDDTKAPGSRVHGATVMRLEEIEAPEVVISVADARFRREMAARCAEAGARFGAVIAPTAIVGDGVELGEGAVICDHCIVTVDAVIGAHFHANIYSYVAHDCRIGDFVTFAPKVCVNGNVTIEDDVYIGTGAVIRPGAAGRPLTIGRGAVVGMGALVTRDVPPGVTVVGNPARPLER